MAKKQKKATGPDLAAEDMIMAEEDLAAMRPALAIAPELVLEILARQRKRRRAKPAKKRAAKKKAAKARKSPARKARKPAAKKKKARKAARRN